MAGHLNAPASHEQSGLEAHLAPIGSADYYLARMLPLPVRASVRALLGLQREWQSLLTRPGDAGVLRLRMYWWRQQLQASTELTANRHPLLRALDASASLPPELLYPRLVAAHAAMAERLDWFRVAEAATLWQNLAAGEGSLGVLLVELVAGRELSDSSASQTLATALAWLEALESARALGQRGLSLIPLDWALAEGLDTEALLTGPKGPAWTRLAERYVQFALEPAESAWANVVATERQASLGLRIRSLHVVERLRLVREGGYAVFQQATELTPLRYLVLALLETYLAWRPRFERLAN